MDANGGTAGGLARLNIAITGASGLVGTRAAAMLAARGHHVVGLRRESPLAGEAAWDPLTGTLRLARPADVLIHLAGRSVATRWSKKVKREIWDSRVPAMQRLCQFLAGVPEEKRPRLLISASAVGIYGNRGEEQLTEASAPAARGKSFLADVCTAWEAATQPAEAAGIPTIHLRIGVVLAKEGGALAKLRLPVKWGLAGPIGTGMQWLPWISLTDLARLIVALSESPGVGRTINAVSPAPARQHEFMRAIGRVMHRPTVFPMPAPVVKMLFGEMGREALLASQRVVSTQMPAGFAFRHSTVEAAVRDAISEKSIDN